MLDERRVCLSVNAIHGCFAHPGLAYQEEEAPDDRDLLDALLRMEAYYQPERPLRPLSLWEGERRITSYELSQRVLDGINEQARSIAFMVHVQNYPDRNALQTPLPHLIHEHPGQIGDVVGLTQTNALGGIEGLDLFQWMLDEGERGVLLMSEQYLFTWQKRPPGGHELQDYSLALEVVNGAGALRVERMARMAASAAVFEEPALFMEEAERGLLLFIQGAETDREPFVIMQNVLHDHRLPSAELVERDPWSQANLLAGDVWLSLARLCQTRDLQQGQPFVLIATDHGHVITYAWVRYDSRPDIRLWKIG